MQMNDWDVLVQQFLDHRNYTPATRDTYTLALSNLAGWCASVSISPDLATPTDLYRFREWLRSKKYSQNTINTRIKNVRSFYEWMRRTGRIARNPTDEIEVREVALAARQVLTVGELAELWSAAIGQDRIIIGLLALCAMTRSEVLATQVQHLNQQQDTMMLAVKGRRGMNDLGVVAIPPQLALEIRTALASRRVGYLVSTNDRGTQAAATYINAVVKRVSRRAGLPFSVTSLTLTQSLRAIAIEQRFSYVSVVRTASHGSVLVRNEFIRGVELPPDEHASIRLGRMLEVAKCPEDQFLLQTSNLLADRALTPAVSVSLAGAVLERCLRTEVLEQEINVQKKDATLNTLATLLRARDKITNREIQTIERISSFRNLAAHGWFDRITREDAKWVVVETHKFVTSRRPGETVPLPGVGSAVSQRPRAPRPAPLLSPIASTNAPGPKASDIVDGMLF